MQTRTSHSQVTFRRPFRLPGMDAAAPAGVYKIDMEEEQLDTLTVDVWRQTSAVLEIATAGVTEHVSVDPQALHAALQLDGEDAGDSAPPVRRPTLGMRRR